MHWKSNWRSTCTSSSLILMDALPFIVTAWKLLLKVQSVPFCPYIATRILSPTVLVSWTFTFLCVVTPVAMFLKEGSMLKGYLCDKYWSSCWMSLLSLASRVEVASLCCSLVVYVTPVDSSIAVLISALVGVERTHTSRWVSVKTRPRVKPPVVFSLRTRHCSMTRSVDNPAQGLSDRRTTSNSWLKCGHSSGTSYVQRL
jgi:hypothetical protein